MLGVQLLTSMIHDPAFVMMKLNVGGPVISEIFLLGIVKLCFTIGYQIFARYTELLYPYGNSTSCMSILLLYLPLNFFYNFGQQCFT